MTTTSLSPYKILDCESRTALEILVEVDISQNYQPLGPAQAYWHPLESRLRWSQTLILRASLEQDLGF